MSDQIVPFDMMRLFLGDAPPLFLAEILLRTAIIYCYTLLLLRFIGGRSVSQLSLIEFLLVIALGSAVGDSLFYPDVPLLHAMAVITLVVAADKALDKLTVHFRLAKHLLDGQPRMIMQNGHSVPETVRSQNMGSAELMSRLRLKGVRNLGEVEYAFLEPGGVMSVFRYDQPRPGLRIVPPASVLPRSEPRSGEPWCCVECGYVEEDAPGPPRGEEGQPDCANCGASRWTVARCDTPAPG